ALPIFEVSDEQAKAAMDAMKKKKDERYWFYTNNCIDAVEDSIDGAGIKRPRQFGFPSNPDKLYDWIGGAK
uniref:hypothetical protein n=1 Tax=Candidatus Electrothrix sp. TaxID=2170559 RepID=UPI0040563193